jgi:RNA-directed DNA polymerase
MKREGNLYSRICTIDNLQLADSIARKGKLTQPGVIEFDKNKDENLLKLQAMLIHKTFVTSEYTNFTIREPKERLISRLPYFPDRIVHHATMNITGPTFVSTFTNDTYSCIKDRGIHAAQRALKKALRDEENTQY